MTALWIVLGILGFLFFLLICPISVAVNFQETISVKLRYLFFSYRVAPKESKEEKPEEIEKEKEPEEHKKSRIQEILEQKGLSGFLNMLQELAKIAGGTAKRLVSHLIFVKIWLEIAVADEDAAQAAIQYGYVCGGVCAAMSVFLHNCKCKRYHIHIVPDFDRKESYVSFSCKVRIQPLFLIASGLYALMRFFKVQKRETEERAAVQQKVPAESSAD